MLIVSRATPEDAAAILALQRVAFQTMAARIKLPFFPPLMEDLDDLLRDFTTSTIAKALWSNCLVGAARGTVSGDVCHIRRMSVHPEFHGRGIGSALLAYVEASVHTVSTFRLFTSTENVEAIRLYKRNGYSITHTQVESAGGPIVFMQKNSAAV
jgi:ribosomal protein S18 acetylase RimI-like enzyme